MKVLINSCVVAIILLIGCSIFTAPKEDIDLTYKVDATSSVTIIYTTDTDQQEITKNVETPWQKTVTLKEGTKAKVKTWQADSTFDGSVSFTVGNRTVVRKNPAGFEGAFLEYFTVE